ncbi:bpX5 domain-containing protein [Pseudomonas sp. GXZC]|uniref:bpX5 domain-containing protein n=1 Tax=Pseudomonas sp. GXZC TaxID=3003351 RepID=UPI0022AA6903|nr:hypothetical protein [Pseudomonas sp. GXZC]WAT25964.1 hypothetical protein OZ428_18435 [Pseudomonas sp. GXZC]
MSALSHPWRWRSRQAPAEAQAAVAWGDAARRMLGRLALLEAEHAARLHATANAEVLVVTGATADLPWVDGVAYAAPSASAPHLWLPTSWEPDVPQDLLGQAFSARFKRSPLLVWREPAAVIPLDRLLVVSPDHLQRIADYWGVTHATA